MDPMDLPSALTRSMGRIVEVLVRRFKETEVKAIHGLLRHQVSAKEDAIRKIHKESARGIWLPPKLRDPRADVNHDIRMVRQQLTGATQVFSAFGHMGCDECSLRMTRDDLIALIKQLLFGKMSPVKTPIGVRRQFLITLVGPINGQEECIRVRDMNHD